MAGGKERFDINKMSYKYGKYYYGDFHATSDQIKRYKKIKSGDTHSGGSRSSDRLTPQKKYYKYFGSSTRLTGRNGYIANWARPLALEGGNKPEYAWKRVDFLKSDGSIGHDSSKRRWGAKINSGRLGAGGILKGSKDWVRQLQISVHQLMLNAEYFRIAVGHRAMKVFQNSFRYKRFYASQSQKWAALSSYTLRKRAKRGTGELILREYKDLYNSIKIEENSNGRTRIFTDIVPADSAHHKKRSVCYAGYHNEGKGTYGNGWGRHKPKPYIRRQFMGHSDEINKFAFEIMKRYLFDSVFMVKEI